MDLSSLYRRYEAEMSVLQCPLCGNTFHRDENSLICEERHCFDFSKKGYINLAPSHRQEKEKYNEELFQARQVVFTDGFYAPVLRSISALCAEACENGSFSLMDAGCGEGYYARSLAEHFPAARLYGCDLSRAAICSAAKLSHDPLWMIADLKHMPFREKSLDILLDVLTPADYTEFRRITKGHLIKVIPGPNYLREIRSAVSSFLSGGESYQNEAVMEHLRQNTKLLKDEQLSYTLPLTPEHSAAFLRMTPMTFFVPEERLREVLLPSITIDMHVCLCKI